MKKTKFRVVLSVILTFVLILSMSFSAYAATKSVSTKYLDLVTATAKVTYSTKYENGQYLWKDFKISSAKLTKKSGVRASADTGAVFYEGAETASAYIVLTITEPGSYVPIVTSASFTFSLNSQTGEVVLED